MYITQRSTGMNFIPTCVAFLQMILTQMYLLVLLVFHRSTRVLPFTGFQYGCILGNGILMRCIVNDEKYDKNYNDEQNLS